MIHSDFEKVVNTRIHECTRVLIAKDKEYSSETDRLHNFKVAGRALGIDPVVALNSMWIKHLVSVWDMIDRMGKDPNYVPSRELVRDKLGDVINYTLLLEGLIEERRKIVSVVGVEQQ